MKASFGCCPFAYSGDQPGVEPSNPVDLGCVPLVTEISRDTSSNDNLWTSSIDGGHVIGPQIKFWLVL